MTKNDFSNTDPVSAQRENYVQALKKADVNSLAALLADDAVFMPPNDPTLYGKDEVRAWHEEYFQYFRFSAFTIPDRSVEISGDWATELLSYMIAIVPVSGGSRIRDDGRFLAIWKRQPDGSWRIWQQLWNSTKPVGIGTNRYMARLMQKKAGVKR